jgi:hypothetical protein
MRGGARRGRRDLNIQGTIPAQSLPAFLASSFSRSRLTVQYLLQRAKERCGCGTGESAITLPLLRATMVKSLPSCSHPTAKDLPQRPGIKRCGYGTWNRALATLPPLVGLLLSCLHRTARDVLARLFPSRCPRTARDLLHCLSTALCSCGTGERALALGGPVQLLQIFTLWLSTRVCVR